MSEGILTRPVAVGGVHGITEVAIATSAEQRAALAEAYDLLAVESLAASATLTPTASGGVDVAGRVTADIVQACVVTLDPVAQHIDEPFSVRFVRPGSPELAPLLEPNAEIVIDPSAEDPPEILDGPLLDVGAVVEEAFVLAIDPYPRVAGAALPELPADGAEGSRGPFAALARLKSKP